jgi:glycosyltransferase involved in cell wall biosynthesis
MKIHQISNAILENDAISNQMLSLKNYLKDLGYDSKIFVKWKDDKIKDDSIVTLSNFGQSDFNIPTVLQESDIIFFHHHSESVLLNILENLKCTKILYYHNITPPNFFKNIDNQISKTLQKGIQQLNQLKSLCQIAIGSKYNQIQLKNMGFSQVFEIPYFIDKNLYPTKLPRIEKENKIYDNIVFVGRIAPNKKQDDLIKIFYFYNNFCNPNSRLFLTGFISPNNPNPYEVYLNSLVTKLGLEHKVIFTGMISFEKLLSLYEKADIFLCMSEHEGFCVPLIESMMMKIPVIAFKSSAIPYTLNNVGIMVDEKNHKLIAKLILKLINDKKLYTKIIKEQSGYIEKTFTKENFKNSLTTIIKEVTNERK